jgi:CheY-like chemotaxis protein
MAAAYLPVDPTRSEHRRVRAVYCEMRVLCVGRHAFLSEHLCRYFGELGAECEAVIGAAAVPAAASRCEPHMILCDSDLLTPAQLDAWSSDPVLEGVPVLAVSLTTRPEDAPPATQTGVAGVIYLPTLDREQGLALLAGAYRPRGVQSPLDWSAATPTSTPPVVR